MSGFHGFASATGARSAVLSAPVRRALLLAALVAGVLVATWLVSAAPVHASVDRPSAEGPVGQATQPDGPAETDRGRSGETTQNRAAAGPRQDRQAPEVRGAAPNASERGADTPAASQAVPVLHAPSLSGAVDGVGEHTSQTVRQASDAVSAHASGGHDRGVVEQVRDAVVRGPAEHAPGHRSDSGERPDDSGTAAPASTGDDVPEADVDVLPALVADAHEHAPDTASGAPSDTDGDTVRNRGTEDDRHRSAIESTRSAVTSSSGSSSSSAPNGAFGGTAVAGYLTSTTASAPLPGLLQAAWHVLRSAPADSADEPTFSPD